MQHQTSNEPNQIGSQHANPQQMMLYPVRVVYETQILVQAGDQIQPNQTIYINPQNPPPWIQNRPLQNQMVYVQNVPNNIVPSVQQHMDQNQMYIQQHYNQQMLQPMMNQTQEIRPYQIPNMTHSVQNNPNIGANNPISQCQPQMYAPNTNMGSNNANERIQQAMYTPNKPNIGQTTSVPTQTNSPIGMKQNFPKSQGVETVQNMTNNQRHFIQMNSGQQINHQINTTRQPQVITVNPMQQTNANVPTFNHTQSPNVSNHRPQLPTLVHAATNAQMLTKLGKPLAHNQTYLYRPIQPRPQYTTNIQNMSYHQNQTTPRMPNIGQNILHTNVSIQNKPQLNVPYQTKSTSTETKTNIKNRKRKSESPDEIKRKLTINVNMFPNTVEGVKKLHEIGVNTSPVPKNHVASTETAPKNDDKKTEVVANTTDMIASIINRKVTVKDEEAKVKMELKAKLDEKDNLVRHTVFTQARGLSTNEGLIKGQVNILKDTKNINHELKVVNNVKTDNKIIKDKLSTSEAVENGNVSKDCMSDLKKSINDLNDKKIEFTNNVKSQEKDFVLTHVLDGIVIQESNMAFPIRDPTTKRTHANPKVVEIGKEELRIEGEKLANSPMTKKIREEKVTETTNDNPFAELKPTTVKSWTVDQLLSYLSKYKWDETVSALQEHEIDGESLFLVNRSQLLRIGVKEEHADTICDYVKNC
ncbi:uncharacterized protein LOC131852284 [Achroia grisella]|uniref:uncharacterized protein LOC131852284 n=1 Tax=Achroia grisella TaxID=688607 RepID=UPI0027D223A6|nr:uncharacterized protein LOC131852284 [Achroia grisella]